MTRKSERQRAVSLRRKGMTYREILIRVPVAKSTLSEWLRSVGLAKSQHQRLTQKKQEGALRGAMRRKEIRLWQIEGLREGATTHVGNISSRELWLLGIALYWAEGSKQNSRHVSTGVMFGNSDQRMLQVFRAWLHLLQVPIADLLYELYIHENRRSDTEVFKEWWAKKMRISKSLIGRVYYKKGNPKTQRTNVGDLYHGLLRIKVRSSTTLNRQIGAWVCGIVENLGDGVVGNTPAFEAGDPWFDPKSPSQVMIVVPPPDTRRKS